MNREIMNALFPKETKRIEEGYCPLCNKKINITDFIDDKSRKEYKISGMCQQCQNKFFHS